MVFVDRWYLFTGLTVFVYNDFAKIALQCKIFSTFKCSCTQE